MTTETLYYPRPVPLTYDPAIYWLEPHVYAEVSVSYEIHGDARIAAMVEAELQAAIAHEAPWAHYTALDARENNDRQYCYTCRRRAFEQPGYTRIEEYIGPGHMKQLRFGAQGGMSFVALDLRPLSYRGEQARGALDGGILYVVRPFAAT